MKTQKSVIFSVPSYAYFSDQMNERGQFERGKIESNVFPDGESYHRILSKVEGRNVVLVGGSIGDKETLEMYDLACALVKCGANALTLVMPYFGYSTMERAVFSGEVVKAKTRARLFSSIPSAANGTRVLLLDLHSEGIPHYFEGNVTAFHLYAKPVILKIIRKISQNDFVLACTDAGRAKWVESLANEIGVKPAFVFKKRLSGTNTKTLAVNADVKNQRVIIYDDMIRTGGSLMNAARAFKDANAKEIVAVTTHGVFPQNSLERIKKSGLISKIYCTNSHPAALKLKGDYLNVESVAEIFSNHLVRR